MFDEVKENLGRLGIEAILFDLDDTLIYTSEIFTLYMQEYASAVAEKIGMEAGEVMEALRTINNEEFKRVGVNPKRWEVVVEKLAKRFGRGEKEVLEGLEVLMKIYSIEPRMRPGVVID